MLEIPASQKCKEPDRGVDTKEIESMATADEAGHARGQRAAFRFVGFLSNNPFTADVYLLQVLVCDSNVT